MAFGCRLVPILSRGIVHYLACLASFSAYPTAFTLPTLALYYSFLPLCPKHLASGGTTKHAVRLRHPGRFDGGEFVSRVCRKTLDYAAAQPCGVVDTPNFGGRHLKLLAPVLAYYRVWLYTLLRLPLNNKMFLLLTLRQFSNAYSWPVSLCYCSTSREHAARAPLTPAERV